MPCIVSFRSLMDEGPRAQVNNAKDFQGISALTSPHTGYKDYSP